MPGNKYFPAGNRQRGIGHSHAVARTAIVDTYKLLGGVNRLWAWVQEDKKNEFAFYTILLPKLIPAEIADQHGVGDTKIQVMILPAEGAGSRAKDMPSVEARAKAMPELIGTDDAMAQE
jgi:hypothetical protein